MTERPKRSTRFNKIVTPPVVNEEIPKSQDKMEDSEESSETEGGDEKLRSGMDLYQKSTPDEYIGPNLSNLEALAAIAAETVLVDRLEISTLGDDDFVHLTAVPLTFGADTLIGPVYRNNDGNSWSLTDPRLLRINSQIVVVKERYELLSAMFQTYYTLGAVLVALLSASGQVVGEFFPSVIAHISQFRPGVCYAKVSGLFVKLGSINIGPSFILQPGEISSAKQIGCNIALRQVQQDEKQSILIKFPHCVEDLDSKVYNASGLLRNLPASVVGLRTSEFITFNGAIPALRDDLDPNDERAANAVLVFKLCKFVIDCYLKTTITSVAGVVAIFNNFSGNPLIVEKMLSSPSEKVNIELAKLTCSFKKRAIIATLTGDQSSKIVEMVEACVKDEDKIDVLRCLTLYKQIDVKLGNDMVVMIDNVEVQADVILAKDITKEHIYLAHKTVFQPGQVQSAIKDDTLVYALKSTEKRSINIDEFVRCPLSVVCHRTLEKKVPGKDKITFDVNSVVAESGLLLNFVLSNRLDNKKRKERIPTVVVGAIDDTETEIKIEQ